jgi:[amino group carrier protein]-lysine/ornithine hydrolase
MDEIALLEGLLNCYSPSGQEAEAVRYLVEQMRAMGFEASVDEAGNAVGAYGAGPQTIMLLGHIDTVAGFIPVRRAGDDLWGRGSVDAKGPLACFVAAAYRAREHMGSRRVVVVGAVGEEAESRGAHYVKGRYQPAVAVIGEPSGWEKITLGYKGSVWYTYQGQRPQAHSAARGENVCEAAVHFWNRVTAWAEAYNSAQPRAFEQVSPTLRGLASNTDGFTDRATLQFNVRLPLSLSVEACDAALRALLEDAELTLQVGGTPAYRGEKNSPLVRAFLAAIRQAGGTPSFSLKSGTADMNVVGPVWNTPIVAYGPGDSALDHTPDEHLSLSEYQRAIDVLSETLKQLQLS